MRWRGNERRRAFRNHGFPFVRRPQVATSSARIAGAANERTQLSIDERCWHSRRLTLANPCKSAISSEQNFAPFLDSACNYAKTWGFLGGAEPSFISAPYPIPIPSLLRLQYRTLTPHAHPVSNPAHGRSLQDHSVSRSHHPCDHPHGRIYAPSIASYDSIPTACCRQSNFLPVVAINVPSLRHRESSVRAKPHSTRKIGTRNFFCCQERNKVRNPAQVHAIAHDCA